MRVLLNFNCSGIGRQEFETLGHDVWTCDLKPAEDGHRKHILGDAIETAWHGGPWDLMIAHPPCNDLAVCGARWFKEKLRADPQCQKRALTLFAQTLMAPIPKKCVENPKSIASSYWPRTQAIQPWQHGHGEVKETWLWLYGLPLLEPSEIVDGREPVVWKMAPGPDRATNRARNYPGILRAMAAQWG